MPSHERVDETKADYLQSLMELGYEVYMQSLRPSVAVIKGVDSIHCNLKVTRMSRVVGGETLSWFGIYEHIIRDYSQFLLLKLVDSNGFYNIPNQRILDNLWMFYHDENSGSDYYTFHLDYANGVICGYDQQLIIDINDCYGWTHRNPMDDELYRLPFFP